MAGRKKFVMTAISGNEEKWVKQWCESVMAANPDLVIINLTQYDDNSEALFKVHIPEDKLVLVKHPWTKSSTGPAASQSQSLGVMCRGSAVAGAADCFAGGGEPSWWPGCWWSSGVKDRSPYGRCRRSHSGSGRVSPHQGLAP